MQRPRILTNHSHQGSTKLYSLIYQDSAPRPTASLDTAHSSLEKGLLQKIRTVRRWIRSYSETVDCELRIT